MADGRYGQKERSVGRGAREELSVRSVGPGTMTERLERHIAEVGPGLREAFLAHCAREGITFETERSRRDREERALRDRADALAASPENVHGLTARRIWGNIRDGRPPLEPRPMGRRPVRRRQVERPTGRRARALLLAASPENVHGLTVSRIEHRIRQGVAEERLLAPVQVRDRSAVTEARRLAASPENVHGLTVRQVLHRLTRRGLTDTGEVLRPLREHRESVKVQARRLAASPENVHGLTVGQIRSRLNRRNGQDPLGPMRRVRT